MEMVLQHQQRASSTTCRPGPATAQRTAPAAMKKEEEEEEAEEAGELRRGPWTVDEDLTLINYIAEHGDGRWNALARAAGLKRTGKSCRLRWLNYLRPDVKRGDFTADEQLLILDLHSRWGNRWSKIAQQLPGRTDNEIKNYWRTRVQKHARQLGCDVNSRRFKDAMTYLWMPRLAERAAAVASSSSSPQLGQQQQQHTVVGVVGVTGNNSNIVNDASAAAVASSSSPCLSAITTTTATTPSAACSLAADENNGSSYYHYSPGASGSCCVVPSSSSSDSSSLTTSNEESVNELKSVHHHIRLPNNNGAADSCGWATAAMQGGGMDHEFWSTAMPALQELTIGSGQFQEDLITGWVQGFSEGISDSLWSLDDIWRMH